MGDGETCPIGYEITTLDRCGEVLKHASTFGTEASSVNDVLMNSIPNQCVINNGNKNIVFSNHSESHNKRWITNEFSMICEAGYFLVDNDRIYSILIRSIIRLCDSNIF